MAWSGQWAREALADKSSGTVWPMYLPRLFSNSVWHTVTCGIMVDGPGCRVQGGCGHVKHGMHHKPSQNHGLHRRGVHFQNDCKGRQHTHQ
jgi:hypothetical protein